MRNLQDRQARASATGTRIQHGQASSRGRKTRITGRTDPLRSVLEKAKVKGVCVHGMLVDLVLLRRKEVEIAVLSVLGSVLRNTIVVQSRSDGARVVGIVKAAGIRGRIRCDILDEMKANSMVDRRGSGESNVFGYLVDADIIGDMLSKGSKSPSGKHMHIVWSEQWKKNGDRARYFLKMLSLSSAPLLRCTTQANNAYSRVRDTLDGENHEYFQSRNLLPPHPLLSQPCPLYRRTFSCDEDLQRQRGEGIPSRLFQTA